MRQARFPLLTLVVLLLIGGVVACKDTRRSSGVAHSQGARMMIQLQSSAFTDGSSIPKKHTCDGANVSPALRWSGVPKGAKSLALIVHDPDAPIGDFTHWLVYGLSPTTGELPEGVATTPEVSGIGKQGTNDFRKVGYGGPCPPPGSDHRYFFDLYALDTTVDQPAAATRAAVENAIRGHVIAQGELMGTFGR